MTTPTNHTSSAAFLFHDDEDGRHDAIGNDNGNDEGNDESGTNEAPGLGRGPGKASTDRASADHCRALQEGLEEERSKISTASSIEGSNILQYTESKSGHSRLSALLGPATAATGGGGTSVVAPSPRHNKTNIDVTGVPVHERPPVASSRGGQKNLSAQQQLLSPLTEEEDHHHHHHRNETSSSSSNSNQNNNSNWNNGSDTPTSRATSVTQQHDNIDTESDKQHATHSLHPGQHGIDGGGGDDDGDHGDDKPMTMSEHRKIPIPPPPTSRPPMFNSSSSSKNMKSANSIPSKTKGGTSGDGGDDDTATAFTVGTNGTHRTFAAVPGNVPSETLHTSNIRRFPSSTSLKASGLSQQAGGGLSANGNGITTTTTTTATATATNTNNHGNKFDMSSPSSVYRVDDDEVDKAAAWAIHLALVFFMTLVVAVVVLSLVVMANYGFVTLVLLVILVGFVCGLGWYVDQTVLSRNPKLRPIRQKLVTVVEAAKEALVEEYHLFVQDWKDHRLLLTQDPNYDDYINAGDAGNTDGILQMDGSPSSSNQQHHQQKPKRKKSKIFKLVKPFLGLRKKIPVSLRRNTGNTTNNNSNMESSNTSYRPPSAAASNASVRSAVPSVTV